MEFWTELRRRVLTDELSKRAACREYELSWHTLTKILTHDEPPGYCKKQPRKKPKLAAFLPIIHQILEDDRSAPKKQRHTAWRIFERLRDEHGFSGGYTIVKDAVRDWKQCHQAGMSHLGLESSARPRGRATGSPIMTNLRVKRNRSPEIHGRIPSAMPPGRSLEAFDGLRCKGCPQLTHDWLRT